MLVGAMSAAIDDTKNIASWTCPTCGSSYPGDFRVCPRDSTPRADKTSALIDPLIGQVLGRTYRITRVVGEGGMARLYEAQHLRVDGKFAVKVIHDDLAREPSLLARFEREARAAGLIRSPNVVRLFDVLRTPDGRPCLITELFEGEDLQALLDRKGKLSVAEAIPIVRQLCRAVASAHAVGVVHRDLKPSNVFLCRHEGALQVKVFDFGVAKLEDDDKLTRTDAVMGTAAYMAPEQARRAADAGPLADVYSIGAVLYHMLTGQMPYGNVPAISRFALVLHEEPARPRSIDASIPPGVEAVIQHAMARETTARARTPADLEAELAAFDAPELEQLAPMPVVPSAAHAIDIAVRARFARPLAVVVAATSSLAVGAWVALVLALLIGAASRGERIMIGLLALVACAGIAFLHVRVLRRRWESATAVIAHTSTPARALVAGLLVFGGFELAAYALFAVFGVTPLALGTRVALAGATALVGLGWRRWKLGERVARRIG
jgi:eukaryotic-like serine/threonine-protein kinase